MKKINTPLLLLIFLAVSSISLLNAQVPDGYYKKYHINQTFDGLEALPTGWTALSSTACFFGHAAAAYTTLASGAPQNFVKVTASGSGTRGGELRFPSTVTSPLNDVTKPWFLEFDWTVNSADWDMRQANGIMISGPGSQGVNTNEDWYGDVILGLYVYKSTGNIHYWNMDPLGEPKRDTEGNIIPGEFNGPAFYNQAGNNGRFTRAGTAKTDTIRADSLNLKTKTNVKFSPGTIYHILAEINFETQKVVKLVITDKSNPENTQTISNLDFLAPTMGGTNSPVAVENRKVTQIDRMQSFHTRSGGSGALNHSYDNWEVYTLAQSLGRKDVTVNYKDRSGNMVKASRVAAAQEVGNPYSLIVADKEGFVEGGYYVAYDAAATHLANASKSADGESLIVSLDGDNSLDVIFKKMPITPGEYVWTGANGFNWNELEDNFSVNGAAAISYQNGNAVTFSGTEALNKEIQLSSRLNLGEGNFTVSAPGYSFTGTGILEGTGQMLINAPTLLGIDSRLAGGAQINTTSPIHIKHAGAAKSFKLLKDNANLKLEAEADFTAPIETPESGTINLECVSNFIYSSVITNASTINIKMSTPGSHNANWRSAWRTTFPTGAQINVTTDLDSLKRPVGFGVRGTDLKNSKLHLGDNVRLLRDYNEGNNLTYTSIVALGELSGTSKAVIEGGFVDGRSSAYEVGYLNTDAVFDGVIRQYMPTDTTSATSLLRLTKMGTGTWTVNGNLLFKGEIIVENGTLVLGGSVNSGITRISVDTAATFVGKKIVAETGIAVNIGTLAGSITANSVSLTGSTLKLTANSFNEGDYDKIVTIGDFSTIAAVDPEDLNILDVTVKSAVKNEKIKLIEVQGNADVSFNKILVNGEDITMNTTETEGAKFAYFWNEATNAGELICLQTIISGIDEVSTEKPVKSVIYYNTTGQVVGKNAKGVLIKKTTFTDGTQAIEKTIQVNR